MNTQDGATIAAPNEATDEKSVLSLDDLASELLAADTQEDTEETETTEEATETVESEELTEETEEEEDTEDSTATQTEDSDEEEEVAEEQSDVLSKYEIPLDEMSEDELKELNKRIGGKSHKRINQLTAQKKQLEEELARAKQEQPAQQQTTGTLKATSIKELETEAETYQQLADWADEALDNEPEYDDDGNEYLAEANGNKYTKADLKNIKKQAQSLIKKEIPQRRNFIDAKEKSDKLAEERFEFHTNAEHELHDTYLQMASDPLFQQVEKILPNAKYVLSAAIIGEQHIMAGTKQSKKKVATTNKPKTKPTPTGAAQPRSTSTKKKQQALASKQNRLKAEGSVDALSSMMEDILFN